MAVKERRDAVESKTGTVIDIAAVIDTVEKADRMKGQERQRVLSSVSDMLNTGVTELLEMSRKVSAWDDNGRARMDLSSSTTVEFDRTTWGPICGFLIHKVGGMGGTHLSADISINPMNDPNVFSHISFSSTKELPQQRREVKEVELMRLNSALYLRFKKKYSSDFTVAMQ